MLTSRWRDLLFGASSLTMDNFHKANQVIKKAIEYRQDTYKVQMENVKQGDIYHRKCER